MTAGNFYNKRYSRDGPAISSALERGQITEDDAYIIQEFIDEARATRHIKDHRALKSLYDLINWRRFLLKPYRELESSDLYTGIKSLSGRERSILKTA